MIGAQEEHRRIEIDFSECEYVSSSGLRVLLDLRNDAAREEDLILSHTNEAIDEVFSVTGFDHLFLIKKEKIENPDIKVAFLMSTESPTPCGILS